MNENVACGCDCLYEKLAKKMVRVKKRKKRRNVTEQNNNNNFLFFLLWNPQPMYCLSFDFLSLEICALNRQFEITNRSYFHFI